MTGLENLHGCAETYVSSNSNFVLLMRWNVACEALVRCLGVKGVWVSRVSRVFKKQCYSEVCDTFGKGGVKTGRREILIN